ncbi:MAG: D-alanyl-D-alanine carboxypeptidase/D-alanyl-D-alanine-endopeptidase, partial [Lewinella sp.]|nr:D-alanyl-D-alanine carboxypeptidase/D-alanyl-D-alanine-endopeptidase [Lewinella sp.]
HTSCSVQVVDVATGQVLAGFDAERSTIPASNLKLLTTASALAILGPDFRFATELAYTGYLDAQGVLQGDLILRGSGDPTLGSPEMPGTPGLEDLLEQWRLAVQRAGIRQVTGRLITDESAFATASTGTHWQWLDLGNYYGCGAFGLNLHDNLYFLHFQQAGRLGATPPVLGVTPAVPGLRFYNEVTSAEQGSGDNTYIYGSPYNYTRYLRGTLPVGSGRFTIKGAIPDPPLFAAQQLAGALESVGILCGRPPTTTRLLNEPLRPDQVVLHTHHSPPLAEIVTQTNFESVNMYAEALLRAIGRAQAGEGSAEAGLAALRDYWTGRGLSWSGVQLYDGSGMAPRNVLTAAFLTSLLRTVYQDEHLREPFWNSLPLAGRTGTLENAMRNTAAAGRLRAKTGSLEQVRAYSGYVPRPDGAVWAFSVMVNNYGEDDGRAIRAHIYRLLERLCQ